MWKSGVFVLLASVAVAGCGGSVIPGSDEPQKVAAVVTSLNDAAGSEEDFKKLFVGGNAPENRAKYFSSAISLVDVPEVNDSEAKAVVKVSQGAAESEGRGGIKSEDVGSGEVTWTLKKEGDAWKIQDAPMP